MWVWSLGSICGLGRSLGGGHGDPLQYSCLENPVDRVAWQAAVHGVAKSRTRLSDLACIQSLGCSQRRKNCCVSQNNKPNKETKMRLWGINPINLQKNCSIVESKDYISLRCTTQWVNIFIHYTPFKVIRKYWPYSPVCTKDTCTPVFIVALFTVAKMWKHPKCSSTVDWIKMWCRY